MGCLSALQRGKSFKAAIFRAGDTDKPKISYKDTHRYPMIHVIPYFNRRSCLTSPGYPWVSSPQALHPQQVAGKRNIHRSSRANLPSKRPTSWQRLAWPAAAVECTTWIPEQILMKLKDKDGDTGLAPFRSPFHAGLTWRMWARLGKFSRPLLKGWCLPFKPAKVQKKKPFF